MPRLKLTLAYQGTGYAGWQLQTRPGGGGPLRTVQGELERCIARITGARIAVHGAGRTDAGVHAEGQVCHLDLPTGFAHVDWRQAINTKLSPDIRITEAAWVPETFHARKSAILKRYAYSLWIDRNRALPRVAPFVWSLPPLELEPIMTSLRLLTGRHDFASFQNSGSHVKTTVRVLHDITCEPGMLANLKCPPDWPVVTFIFTGDGFLKQMARNLMGLLIWVAQGKVPARAIRGIFEARDRRALPSPSAPAQGLTLLEIGY